MIQPTARAEADGSPVLCAPHLIEVRIAARVRARRIMLGMSREGLAESLGVGARDIEDIENGTPHLTARQLDALGRALDVPVAFFFDDRGTAPTPATGPVAGQNKALRSALRLLLIAIDLADGGRGIDEDHYQAAKSTARNALAAE